MNEKMIVELLLAALKEEEKDLMKNKTETTFLKGVRFGYLFAVAKIKRILKELV